MSDVGRYRKLYLRLWRHRGFVALTSAEKIVAIYVLAGPQSNRLGLYALSPGAAAEHLGIDPEAFRKHLVTVCQTFGWSFDGRARVMFIPSWFRWNPPENVNVLKGAMKDLDEIPPCASIKAFASNAGTLAEALQRTFLEGLQKRFPDGPPIQDQYQDQDQDQDQKHTALTRARAKRPSAVHASGNGDGLQERFDLFWRTYPKKVGKDPAWKAWQKRRPSQALTEAICAALSWQVTQDDWLRDGGRYVPYPSTYLNQERWQDEPGQTPRLNDSTLAIGRAGEEFLKS